MISSQIKLPFIRDRNAFSIEFKEAGQQINLQNLEMVSLTIKYCKPTSIILDDFI